MKRQHKGFTLVELLVVIAIIAILAAILLPVFKRVQEQGYQANCASNLQQIGQAVQLYRQDEKAFPGSLAFLLPTSTELNGPTPSLNTNGTGYLKNGLRSLLCQDDDTSSNATRSSYGDVSTLLTSGPPLAVDAGRYMWNYLGYKSTGADAGTAYISGSPTDETAYLANFQNEPRFLTDPSQPYDPAANPINAEKLPRLRNRFAPPNTIITHCIYHRLPTANNLASPMELSTAANPSDAEGAKDLILRLDGSVKPYDVSLFHTNGSWTKQGF